MTFQRGNIVITLRVAPVALVIEGRAVQSDIFLAQTSIPWPMLQKWPEKATDGLQHVMNMVQLYIDLEHAQQERWTIVPTNKGA